MDFVGSCGTGQRSIAAIASFLLFSGASDVYLLQLGTRTLSGSNGAALVTDAAVS